MATRIWIDREAPPKGRDGIRKLLVGYTGSAASKDAVALAEELGEATGATLEVVTCVPRRGRAEALARLAARHACDGIVIGSGSEEQRSRLAEQLLEISTRALFIAPRGYAEDEHLLSRVAIACDQDRSASTDLARRANELAWDLGARATVADPVGNVSSETLDSVAGTISPELGPRSIVVENGATGLAELDTDLLVLGSESAAAPRNAGMPLLIVPQAPLAGNGRTGLNAGHATTA